MDSAHVDTFPTSFAQQRMWLLDRVLPAHGVYNAGDVIRIDFRGGQRVVLNTQRPARQLWLAGGASAWHFSYDPARDSWLDDKGRGVELYAQLAALAKQAVGLELRPPASR